METEKKYWNSRFLEKNAIWGFKPSKAAQIITDRLKPCHILDVGCGYGRDLNLFGSLGFNATGVDYSKEAVNVGNRRYPKLNIIITKGDKLPFPDSYFDAVFGNFYLHLITDEKKRLLALNECFRVTRVNGYVIQSVASVKDADYGKGREISKDVYISPRGVAKLFYSKARIKSEFSDYPILEIIELKEEHTHDEPHMHISWLIISFPVRNFNA